MSLAPGSKIGPYEILELIGKGGMGEVYRAHDPRLRRDVAIKTSAQRFGERFEREARAVAALNHPNICQVYDVGPDYLVMELIEGPTLGERIKEGAIPLDEALRIADQMAEALAAAHEKLITHRDLKPGNVKIKDDGTVKVLDFGLAKIGGTPTTSASDDSPTLSMTLTQAGMILGTAAYMSPEQARGKPVDSRSDIWAFGVVLFEMLTARRLFKGEDLTETLAGIVKEAPDLSAIPAKVRPLLEACLQKDPKKRLQSIGDRAYLLIEPTLQRNWLWPAVAGAIALGAAVLSWIHFRETPPAVQSLRTQLTRPGDIGFAHFQLSPDGRYLAFVSRPSSGVPIRLYVRALDSLQDREFPGTDGTTYPFWSPDGTHIAFFSQGQLKQVPLGGGPSTKIADAPDPRGGTWGPDNTIVFAPSPTGTLSRVTVSTDGSGGPATPMKLPRPEEAEGDSARFPAFLPDSNRFFYTVEAKTRENEAIYVGSLGEDPPVRILRDLSTTRFVPSPGSDTNGFILFRRKNTLMAQPFDAAILKTTGEAFPLADEVPDSGNTSNVAFTVSANGTLLYLSSADAPEEREIVFLDKGGKRGKSILKMKGITNFALSPDKTQLAYSLASQRVQGDLWLRDMARGASQRFTFGPFNAFSPVWSPDSSTVAFTTYPADRLTRKATQTSAKEELLGVAGTNTFASQWSADGKFLVYSQTGATSKNDLWLLEVNGAQKPRAYKHTDFSEENGEISPDGRWMAYNSDASGQAEVYIESMATGGAPRQISLAGGISPHWRSDGRELYFISERNLMAVDLNPGPELTFKTPHVLFEEQTLVNEGRGVSYQPNADGSQFLMLLPVGGAPTAPPLTVVTNWIKAYGK